MDNRKSLIQTLVNRKLYPKKKETQEKITTTPQVAPQLVSKQPALQPKQQPIPLSQRPLTIPEDPLKRILFLKRTIGI